MSTSVQLSAEEVERFLDSITTGTLEEVLVRIAVRFVPGTTERMRQRLDPTAPDLCAHLAKSRGPNAHSPGRRRLTQLGASLRRWAYKPHRHGGPMLKSFDDLLREEAASKPLGEDVVHYFRALFTDQRGWNIRNDVLPWNTPLPAFSGP